MVKGVHKDSTREAVNGGLNASQSLAESERDAALVCVGLDVCEKSEGYPTGDAYPVQEGQKVMFYGKKNSMSMAEALQVLNFFGDHGKYNVPGLASPGFSADILPPHVMAYPEEFLPGSSKRLGVYVFRPMGSAGHRLEFTSAHERNPTAMTFDEIFSIAAELRLTNIVMLCCKEQSTPTSTASALSPPRRASSPLAPAPSPPRRASSPLGQSSASLLSCESGVSQEYANHLQDQLQRAAKLWSHNDLEAYYPSIVFSYSTGTRPDIDEPGAGPGLVAIVRIQMVCFRQNIPTYSGLTLPVAEDWEVFKLRIAYRGEKKAKVLVALLSEAFYKSDACLEEVHLAVEHHIPVIPVRLEKDLPELKDQWPKVDGVPEPPNKMVKINKAQAALGNNAIPPRGAFQVPKDESSHTSNMDDLLMELRKYL